MKTPKSTYRKVTLTMPIDMLEHLESIGQENHRNGGLKLARTEIVRAMVVVLEKLDIDWTKLKNSKDLKARIEEALRRY